MVDESIKIVLNKEGQMDFNPLYDHMEKSGLVFKNRRIRQAMGIATYNGIYLDMDKFCRYTDKSKYFVILHEMCHGKRIKKFGKKWLISQMSIDDFDAFCEYIINEEIIADRYATYVLFKLTGEVLPKESTQQLYLPKNQEEYKRMIRPLFGVVNNDEETYDKLFNTYLID
jgi:hypothetical protein